MKKKNFIVVLMLFVFYFIGQNALAQHDVGADSKVIWSCKKLFGKENILWLIEWGSKSYIKVFDERISATYQMEGLEKRWNWGLDKAEISYQYAITLSPDRTALYYDFTTSEDGKARSKDVYNCKKINMILKQI